MPAMVLARSARRQRGGRPASAAGLGQAAAEERHGAGNGELHGEHHDEGVLFTHPTWREVVVDWEDAARRLERLAELRSR
jgi:hypothetical protein